MEAAPIAEETEQIMEGQDARKEESEESNTEADEEAKIDDSHEDPSSRMSWDESFKRLLAFREEYGHCRVPNRYKEDPRLGSWGKITLYLLVKKLFSHR